MKPLCRETLERAYLILDGEEISHEERVTIETHLHDCAPCFERYGLEIEVKKVISRLNGSTPCPESLKQKIADLLDRS